MPARTEEQRVRYQQNRATRRRERELADPEFAEKRRQERARRGPRWETHIFRTYGLTQADYDALLERQGGGCAICGGNTLTNPRIKKMPIDHCHATDAVRGVLCNACNNGLGMFRDDPARLRAAAAYLEAHIEHTGGSPE